MRDAFGGVLNIFIIAIFLVLVSGILGLTVNYTKAFRMKNFVISAIEEYDGQGCFKDGPSGCKRKIEEKAKSIGYHPVGVNCRGYEGRVSDIFCYKENTSGSGNNKYYSIVTQVDINIPIINKLMGLSFFQVHGDTRVIRK